MPPQVKAARDGAAAAASKAVKVVASAPAAAMTVAQRAAGAVWTQWQAVPTAGKVVFTLTGAGVLIEDLRALALTVWRVGLSVRVRFETIEKQF